MIAVWQLLVFHWMLDRPTSWNWHTRQNNSRS